MDAQQQQIPMTTQAPTQQEAMTTTPTPREQQQPKPVLGLRGGRDRGCVAGCCEAVLCCLACDACLDCIDDCLC